MQEKQKSNKKAVNLTWTLQEYNKPSEKEKYFRY